MPASGLLAIGSEVLRNDKVRREREREGERERDHKILRKNDLYKIILTVVYYRKNELYSIKTTN